MNKKQAIYETRWRHAEIQRKVEHKMDITKIDLNKGVHKMTKLKPWSLEDVCTLSSNRFRPMNELLMIFKNKYTAEEIEARRDSMRAIMKNQAPTKSGATKTKMTDAIFKFIYEHREIPIPEFKALYAAQPTMSNVVSINTASWYVSAIRAEIRGVETPLPQYYYELLRFLYDSTHETSMPERGSAGSRKNSKQRNKNVETPVPKNSITQKPLVSIEDSNKVEVQNAECASDLNQAPEEKKVPADPEDIKASINEKDYFSENAKFGYAILINNEIKVFGDYNFIKGAEAAYGQLGFASCIKKARILYEEIQ